MVGAAVVAVVASSDPVKNSGPSNVMDPREEEPTGSAPPDPDVWANTKNKQDAGMEEEELMQGRRC